MNMPAEGNADALLQLLEFRIIMTIAVDHGLARIAAWACLGWVCVGPGMGMRGVGGNGRSEQASPTLKDVLNAR
jgi:hypothetical protein